MEMSSETFAFYFTYKSYALVDFLDIFGSPADQGCCSIWTASQIETDSDLMSFLLLQFISGPPPPTLPQVR